MYNFIFKLLLIFIFLLQVVNPSLASNIKDPNSSINYPTDGFNYQKPAQFKFIAGRYEGPQMSGGLYFINNPEEIIYWSSSEKASFAPKLECETLENIKDIKINWPVPELYQEYLPSKKALNYIGYKGEIILPINFTTLDLKKAAKANCTASYIKCSKAECFILKEQFDFNVEPGFYSPSNQNLINKYQFKVPHQEEVKELTLIETPDDKLLLKITLDKLLTEKAELFLKNDFNFILTEKIIERDPGNNISQIIIELPAGISKAQVTNTKLALVVNNDPEFLHYDLNFGPGPSEEGFYLKFLMILGIAFLGGIILNIMPCVLPVISIKLFSIIKHHSAPRQKSLYLSTALGIITSFVILALITLGIKATGGQMGWGTQFQNPYFIIFLCLGLTVFICSLLETINIQIPGQLNNYLYQAVSKNTRGLINHFIMGVFAAIFAMPCTAPFLGTAVSFALAARSNLIIFIFIAMGIGMALPYLLIIIFPGLLRYLPKPGKWMESLKKILVAFLAGTILWLLFTLSYQLNSKAALMVFFGCILMKFWLENKTITNLIYKLVIIGLTILLTFKLPFMAFSQSIEKRQNIDRNWQEFDLSLLKPALAENRVVIIDISASWCISCQFNKKFVLDTKNILNYLKEHHILAMRADWTKSSKVVDDFLYLHGRYAIPFTVVYGPKAPQGILLPPILTAQRLMEAINQASK